MQLLATDDPDVATCQRGECKHDDDLRLQHRATPAELIPKVDIYPHGDRFGMLFSLHHPLCPRMLQEVARARGDHSTGNPETDKAIMAIPNMPWSDPEHDVAGDVARAFKRE